MKWLTALFFVLGSAVAHAEGGKFSVTDNPKWKEECGSCHIAYPPGLLTADDWQKMMGGLDKHFGSNAVLDAEDNKEILNFLQHNAGKSVKLSAPNLRVSNTHWFTREHREISSNIWIDPAVKSRSNCSVCHVNAERGDWLKRSIRASGS